MLIVDRDEAFRSAAATRLRQEGCPCDTAADGAEASDRLNAAQYDVVVVEDGAPGTDHLPWAARTRRSLDGLSVIVVLGGQPLLSTIETVRRLAVACLVKPIDFAELFECVRTAARFTRDHRSAARRMAGTIGRSAGVEHRGVRGIRPGPMQDSMGRITAKVQQSLATLQRLTDVLTDQAGVVDQNYLGAPARLNNARDLVREAARILDQSRRAFHSERLDQLRHRLQVLLDDWKDGEP